MQEQKHLTREEQTEVTRVLVKTAQMLASCGAESRIIEQTTCRLGKTLGMESVEGGKQKVTAMVPQAEMLSYAVDLRAITRGMGVFVADVDHYDEVPGMVATKIIEAYKKEREKDKSE